MNDTLLWSAVLFLECYIDTDCKQFSATCYKGMCKCKDELIRDGKACKPGKDLTNSREINLWGYLSLQSLFGYLVTVNGQQNNSIFFMVYTYKLQNSRHMLNSRTLIKVRGFTGSTSHRDISVISSLQGNSPCRIVVALFFF